MKCMIKLSEVIRGFVIPENLSSSRNHDAALAEGKEGRGGGEREEKVKKKNKGRKVKRE